MNMPLSHWLGRGLSWLVDPTIVLSFDRTGFRIHSLTFAPHDLDVDLSGRRCLVSGANAGLGYEIARGLAERQADVVLLCRSPERGAAAAQSLRQATGNAHVSNEVLDVSDLQAVRQVASRLAEGPVDVLVHNAGLLPAERSETALGLEITFATHVAGPHLLTKLLRPSLALSSDARVVWVSSGGMYSRRLELTDPQWLTRPYDGVRAYAETKRAQVILAELWAEVLRPQRITVNAMHPGWADTGGVQTSLPTFHRLMQSLLRTPAEGADTAVWLAASPSVRGRTGEWFFDRQARSTHYLPNTRESESDRQALWALCERLTSGPTASP